MPRSPSEPRQVIYYSPSRETIARFVRKFCVDLEADGETAVNTEEIRSGLADILEVIAAVGVNQLNGESGKLLDTGLSRE